MILHVLIATIAILLLFYLIRSNPVICAAGCAGVLVWFAYAADSGNDFRIAALGLVLYGFGLSIVRVMLDRSVSLRILQRISQEESPITIRDDIAGRLADARRHRLIRESGAGCELTFFGRSIAICVAICRRILRLNASWQP